MDRGTRQRTNFQRNLRRECERFGTIADFCRAADINRQQFNKYLAGTATPNLNTLKKISRVLGINTNILFEESNSPPSGAEPDITALRKLLSLSEKISLDPNVFPDNLYYCYMSIPDRQDLLMKSLLAFSNKGSYLKFIRLTLIRASNDRTSPLITGRHSGIVCASGTEIFLLGANRHVPYQISLMTLNRSSGTSRGFYTGMILTRVASSPVCSRVHVQAVDKRVNVRDAIRRLGFVNKSEVDQGAMLLSGQSS